jgi:AAA domain
MAPMSLVPVEPARRLTARKEEHRAHCRPVVRAGRRHRRRRAQVLQVVPRPRHRRGCGRRHPLPAPLRSAGDQAASCSMPPRTRSPILTQVITAPNLRLDLDSDRNNLADTVAHLQPRLLILDYFVRLHRIDENASGEVAPLLAYLRELQRRYGVAVLVVHHARKGAGTARAGQALRGSSGFHAWGDTNLYLRRDGDDLTLTVEHRAAPHLVKSRASFSAKAKHRNSSRSPLPLANGTGRTGHRCPRGHRNAGSPGKFLS